MKVHILWYDYYEDSDIVGIYTEEGKKKKIEELQQEALERAKDTVKIWEKKLIERKENRKIHLRKVEQAINACKDFPENKSFRRLKKSLIKEDEQLLKDIQYAQLQIGFYSSSKMLEDYMEDKKYIWLEREVIE